MTTTASRSVPNTTSRSMYSEKRNEIHSVCLYSCGGCHSCIACSVRNNSVCTSIGKGQPSRTNGRTGASCHQSGLRKIQNQCRGEKRRLHTRIGQGRLETLWRCRRDHRRKDLHCRRRGSRLLLSVDFQGVYPRAGDGRPWSQGGLLE